MAHMLYKRDTAWGLPSHSPGCIQAEALLRFAGTDFNVVVQNEPGTSPTGMHPAFEHDRRLVGTAKAETEFDCAREIYAFLKTTHSDPDSTLTQSQTATAQAASAFIQKYLEPATLTTAWCEDEGFTHYRKAYGGKLFFPLNFLVAKSEQRRIAKLVKGESKEKVYEKACSAMETASHLLGEKQKYLFGDAPCSADAFLYGHLLFYRLAPVVTPALQRKLYSLENLRAYVERITSNFFAELAPVVEAVGGVDDGEEEEMTSAWSTAPAGDGLWSGKKLWEEFMKMDRVSRWWLSGASTLLLLYSWFRPPFVLIAEGDGSFADEEDDTD